MRSFVRTEAGTAAVTNPRVFLPTRLRAVLSAIDGAIDPARQTIGSLRPEELRLMLETLCKVGYVVEVDGPPDGPSGSSARPAVAQPSPPPSTPMPRVGTTPARPASDADVDVATVVSCMTDFVMQHLAANSLEILFALEGLTSAAQLRAGLPAYAQAIGHLGPTARLHLAEIEAALTPHPAPISHS